MSPSLPTPLECPSIRPAHSSESSIDGIMAHQPISRWTPAQCELAITRLMTLKFFLEARLSREATWEILEASNHLRLTAGEIIFRQGERTDFFYVIVTGLVEFVRESKGKVVGVAHAGEGFGELGFITGKPRGLTARSGPQTQLLLIPAEAYTAHLVHHAEFKVRHVLAILKRAPMLQGLTDSAFRALSYSAEKQESLPFPSGGARGHSCLTCSHG